MKTIKKSLLAVTLLSSTLGSGMPIVHASHTQNPAQETSASTFAISVIKDEAVQMTNLPTSAAEGTRVDFSLSYDANHYLVESVLVNEEKPMRNGDNYSFLMPAKEVTITILGTKIGEAIDVYPITNLDADKDVVLSGLPTTAKAGETLTFRVEFGWNSGYSFQNQLSIYTIDESGDRLDSVEFQFLAADKTFQFTMPSHPVEIDVETVAKKFTITRDSLANENISSLKYSTDGGATYTSNSATSLNLLYGTKIQLTLKKSDALIPTSLKLQTNYGTLPVSLDPNTLVAEFDMPASPVSFLIEGDVNYKSVVLDHTEHLTITLLDLQDDGTYSPLTDMDHLVPSKTVYFKVESIDEDYIVNTVKVTYNGSSTVTLTKVDDVNSIYSFVMKNYNDVTIHVTEKNVGLYKGKSFVGQFYGFNLYGSTNTGTEKTCVSSYDMLINGAGEVYKGGTTATTLSIASLSSITPESQDGLIALSTGKDIIYTPNFLLSHYSLNNTFANNYGNDMLLATKRINDEDTRTNYTFTFLWNKGNFVAVQSYRVDSEGNSTYIASFFVDFVNKEYYGENLEFVLAEDTTTIATTTSTFDIRVNGIVIGTVSNNAYTKANA